MLHSHHLLSRFSPPHCLSPPRQHPPFIPPRHRFLSAPGARKAVSRVAGLTRALLEAEEDSGGPIELPPSSRPSLFAVDDNPSTIQVATSVLLTGAISVFLFRSIRRRAKRAKELRVRSTGFTSANVKEEALASLKAMAAAPVEAGAPPSPAQAFLGSIAAGVIALILYKFATTVEASLGRQTISDNFSVRQITITVRTIVNGVCYLATFVFGINSVGLFLYSIQLLFASLTGNDTDASTSSKKTDNEVNVVDPTTNSSGTEESKMNDEQETTNDS